MILQVRGGWKILRHSFWRVVEAKTTLQEAAEWFRVDMLEPASEQYQINLKWDLEHVLSIQKQERPKYLIRWLCVLGWVPPKADSGEDLSISNLFERWYQEEPIGEWELETEKEKETSTGYYDQITAMATGDYSYWGHLGDNIKYILDFWEVRKLQYLPSNSYLTEGYSGTSDLHKSQSPQTTKINLS